MAERGEKITCRFAIKWPSRPPIIALLAVESIFISNLPFYSGPNQLQRHVITGRTSQSAPLKFLPACWLRYADKCREYYGQGRHDMPSPLIVFQGTQISKTLLFSESMPSLAELCLIPASVAGTDKKEEIVRSISFYSSLFEDAIKRTPRRDACASYARSFDFRLSRSDRTQTPHR